MTNLFDDTIMALRFYNCNTDTIEGVVFYNEDHIRLEKITWDDFTTLAKETNYNPCDYEFIGFRAFKSRLFVIGQGWFLARTLPCDNYEGWKYYDHDLDFDTPPIETKTSEDHAMISWISDLGSYYSDYVSDEAYQKSGFPGTYTKPPVDGGLWNVGIIHGINGRIWWHDYLDYNKNAQLLYNPELADMVISGDYKDTTVFNNANISRILGVEDAGYNEDQTGELTVTYIPINHFTICLDSEGNEVVVPTVPSPYSKSL